MNVTILGATGSMGREITSQLIRSRALTRREILQLATNPFAPRRQASRLCADGIRRDLQDAYAEINPEIQVVEDPEEFIGDIVVVAAGGTLKPGDFARTRQDLLAEAEVVCRHYAAPLAASLTANEITPIFLIVSNPVEFVVQAFAHALAQKVPGGERFVIGMGSHSDSLRFQWEIAHDLGVVRDRVSASVVGEHGPLMIPRWSTVQIRGMPEREQERSLTRLFAKDKAARDADFDTLLAQRQREVLAALREVLEGPPRAGRQRDVLRMIEDFRPDFRVILKPIVIHHTNSKTAHATGVAAVSLIQGILKGEPLTPNVQRMVAPPAGRGRAFPFGVPTPLAEQFRFSGERRGDDWGWRAREFAAGSFRAARAAEEEARIEQGIAAIRPLSERWQAMIESHP